MGQELTDAATAKAEAARYNSAVVVYERAEDGSLDMLESWLPDGSVVSYRTNPRRRWK